MKLLMNATFDILAAEYQEDPYPFYARMRAEGLSRIMPGGHLVVSRYADVSSILRNPALFSSAGFGSSWEPDWLRPNPCAHSMHSMDPPDHTKLRSLVSLAFLPRVIERTTPLIDGLARAVVQKFLDQGEVEVVSEIALPVTAGTIGSFMRLDPALHSKLKVWSDALMSIKPVPRSPEHVAHVRACVDEMTRYLISLIEERRRSPGEDMVSALLEAEVGGQRLTVKELIPFLALLIVGALDSTSSLVTNSLLLLTQRPDILDRLRADISLVPLFLDEVLRYWPPAHAVFRSVKSDTEIAGQRVAAGETLLLMLAAANRDEQQFHDPEVFHMDRDSRGGLAFGLGIHVCVGMSLARTEVRVTLSELLRHFQRFERVGPPVPWNHTYLVRALKNLRLRGVRA